jgi:hypothetical protein
MQKTAFMWIATLLLTLVARAQDAQTCKFPVTLERLAANAAEVVDVTMDSSMLQFAGKFLNKN